MTYFNKIACILLFFSFIFSSCDYLPGTIDEDVVATAYGEKLYMSDIQEIVPDGATSSDSVNIIKKYIDNWIRQQIFLEHAMKNLNKEEKDFDSKIRDYKNSLIIFAYENQVLKQKLDTVVNQEKVKEYYESHKKEFKLKDNIVKVNYIKIPKKAPDQDYLKRIYKTSDPRKIVELEEYCVQNAATYHLSLDAWLIFSELLREIPLNISNQENFLKNNSFIEISDDYYRYFLYIHDYKLKGSISPLTFVEGEIKKIILNYRKQQFINKLRNELFREADNANSFEIFI